MRNNPDQPDPAPPPAALEAARLVAALGGPTVVAKALGIHRAAVCNWYGAKTPGLPWRRHAALWRLAQANSVDWTPPGFEGLRLVPVDHAPECSRSDLAA